MAREERDELLADHAGRAENADVYHSVAGPIAPSSKQKADAVGTVSAG